MTKEEKDLLLKELCARLPYGVKARVVKRVQDDSTVLECINLSTMWMVSLEKRLEDVKPFLRPMSSMTEDELNEYENFITSEKDDQLRICNELVFYNRHHFDYHGLIPMGLALEAPEDMYK